MSTTTRTEDFDSALWTRPRFEDLSAHAALLYIWSWSNSHVGLAGLYEVGRRTIARESKVPEEELDAALEELSAIGWIAYEDGVLWAPARVARLRPRSRQMATGVVRALRAIDEHHPLRARWLGRYGGEAWLQDALADAGIDPRRPSPDGQPTVTGPSTEGQETVGRGSGDGHETADSVGDSLTVTRPSPEGHVNFQGKGKGKGFNELRDGARATPPGTVDQHSLPDDFPARLADRAEQVLVALRAIQQRVSPASAPPTLHRVGLAMRAAPDVDHLALCGRLEMWAMEPRRLAGRNRHGRDLDVPGTFLEFCQRAQRDAGGAAAAGREVVQSARDVLAAREAMREQRRAAVRG